MTFEATGDPESPKPALFAGSMFRPDDRQEARGTIKAEGLNDLDDHHDLVIVKGSMAGKLAHVGADPIHDLLCLLGS